MKQKLEKQLVFESMKEIKQKEKREQIIKTMYLTSIVISASVLLTTIVSAGAYEVGYWSTLHPEYIETAKEVIKYLFN
jgi:hypothetical protein